ncbi:efflux RND transporter periplasmic adaptor subunit [Chryseobacterium balustinum]|uniref:Macrolide-specific efflux protein macA n=1 Tax=Chryseobacterium balustinum TaxID=246 RepID=A0AAX2IJS7_9FLAO|nr:efflux RND transporter periplasmic adaptor subunit [Chryseobacterium balustinum]AZB30481.1 efflux RND transporter periplasmic adaptor subunit [Chryseobacterium balustinum]SKB48380.1 RND family efflux transporter, MFP subunit [Chryseobacterium balustinum]SQA89111.1 Macrolide-specific efflux protein macA precursor [Chryseobacterium balustinum]
MQLKNIIPFAALMLLAACNTPENKDNKPKPVMEGMGMMNMMETIEISKSNPVVPLKLAGELKPYEQTELFAKVNSYVKNIKVDIGDRVFAGQVLMVLEAPEIVSQIANAKAKVQAQEAIFLSTKATYNRMVKADETKGAVAKDAVDQIKARKLSDESQLAAARSAYNEIRNINDYLVIRAPFSGIITNRSVDLGAYVGPMSKSPLLIIENNQKLRLNLSVPEANTPYIKIGDTIRFYVRSQPQIKHMALVSRKSGSLDAKLRSEKMEADFINKKNVLKPYMVAETSIPLQNTEATFFVPKMAVVESGMGIYVIRVENGKTKNIPVSKGRMMDDKVEVFGELNQGDKILKMASEEIVEGTAVPHSDKKMTKK